MWGPRTMDFGATHSLFSFSLSQHLRLFSYVNEPCQVSLMLGVDEIASLFSVKQASSALSAMCCFLFLHTFLSHCLWLHSPMTGLNGKSTCRLLGESQLMPSWTWEDTHKNLKRINWDQLLELHKIKRTKWTLTLFSHFLGHGSGHLCLLLWDLRRCLDIIMNFFFCVSIKEIWGN